MASQAERLGRSCCNHAAMLVFQNGRLLCAPFMQYPELATRFELSCMRHVEGLSSRVTSISSLQMLWPMEAAWRPAGGASVDESFGASLAVAVAAQIDEDPAMMGLVVVDHDLVPPLRPRDGRTRAALSVHFSTLSTLSRSWRLRLVLTPATQAPAFLALLASLKSTLLANPYAISAGGALCLPRAAWPWPGIGASRTYVFAPEDRRSPSEWLAPAADVANEALPHLVQTTPILAVVGDADRLLPSLDESARLAALAAPHETWRGTVVVPGAGHASTLGTSVNLLAEIRGAFATELANNPDSDAAADAAAAGRLATPPLLPCDESEGWARGLLDRTYEPVPPKDYLRYSRGGDLYPGGRTGGN